MLISLQLLGMGFVCKTNARTSMLQPPPPAIGPVALQHSKSMKELAVEEDDTPPELAGLTLYSIGNPTSREQYSLELINRARKSASAEAQRLAHETDPDTLFAYSFFSVDLNQMILQFESLTEMAPPLAMNAHLLTAARLHSLDMYTNAFQGHSSSASPPAPNQPGDSPGDRIFRQGYDYNLWGENAYAFADTTLYAHNGFDVDWGYDAYGMQDPPGHRENIHNASYREVGIGIVTGMNTVASTTVGPVIVTEDFARETGRYFITGVAYYDANTNLFYDMGEGIGYVTVRVSGVSFYAVTPASGGYAIPVPGNGSYEVTFTTSGYEQQVSTVAVSGFQNVKQDYRATLSLLAGSRPIVGDFDGDGKAGYGIYFDPTGYWQIKKTTDGLWETSFGFEGTDPITGDFDGDGKMDFGAFYPPTGYWYIYKSTGGFWVNNFGYDGTIPFTGDFDGDGTVDFGCYYPPAGAWYIYQSAHGFRTENFGYAGTKPITGDFDGDLIRDFGCYYAPIGQWYIYKSKDGFWTTNFGYDGTKPITGDFDGDGIEDFGCYYPPAGLWYIYKSHDGFWTTQFGYTGTLPVVADFDGDGRSDFGCYDPPTGRWFLYCSTEGFKTDQTTVN